MSAPSQFLAQEKFWANKAECEDAEYRYYAKLHGKAPAESQATAGGDADDEIDLFGSSSDNEAPAAPVAKPPVKKAEKSKMQQKAEAHAAKQKAAAAAKKAQPAQEANKSEVKSEESVDIGSGSIFYQNPANGERSFIMLKPDAVQRGLVGQIVARFEKKGFKLVAMKFMHASKELLESHYCDLSKKPFFPELIRYMSSGPVVPMVWEGVNVVKTGRMMLGETNPKDSAPGTIRGDFCIDVGRNICHGSDSIESAKKEIGMWFMPHEVPHWRSHATQWVYENEEIETSASAEVDGLAALTSAGTMELQTKITGLEKENKNLKKVTDDLRALVIKLEGRVASLEKGGSAGGAPKAAPAPAAADDDDDDVDLFGSSDEEESEEKKRITEERLKAYHEKKSKKPALIAKTSVLLDIKPWDDETDMDKMLECAKTIEKDGLVWGAHKLVPVGYGIKKLQLMCVVEDEKVSIDELCEQIQEFEDYVQSVDISSMSKI